jgi:acid stress chaperone HdeB
MTKGLIRIALSSPLVIAATFGPAKAQTIVEMSALKCGDYLGSPPERQEQFAAWMSGYFNAERNMPMVDLKRFATNKKLVEKYCRGHKKDNLMNVIRKVAA